MWRLFYTLYKQHDAEFDLSGATAAVDDDAAVESLEFIQQLLDGTICTPPNGDYGTAVSEFMSGGERHVLHGRLGAPPPPRTQASRSTPSRSPPRCSAPRPPTPTRTRSRSRTSRTRTPPSSARRRTSSSATSCTSPSTGPRPGTSRRSSRSSRAPEYQALLPQAHYAPAAEILNYDPEAWFTGSGSDFQSYFLETVQNVYLQGDDAAKGFAAFVRRVNVQLAKPNPV